MRILSSIEWDEIQSMRKMFTRLQNANRWLSEFDDFMVPFWTYIGGDIDIGSARTEMRRALEAKIRAVAQPPIDCGKP